MLKLNGVIIEVDYAEELEEYISQFNRVRIRGNKLQACSPFRNEHNPSFAVNLENGTWIDSGSDDEANRKGNFVTLLAFLRNESYNETIEHLFGKYTTILDDVDGLELKLKLDVGAEESFNADDILKKTLVGSDYLAGRGIPQETQELFDIGTLGNAVVMPWRDKDGNIVNFKFRDTKTKKFWYSDGGELIRYHVYGLWLVKKINAKTVWAVESEIDCMYLWALGIPAVAFGHGAMTDRQKTLILNSGIETLIIATDNDTVGERFAGVLIDEFVGWFDVKRLPIPQGKKDVNDMTAEEIYKVKDTIRDINLFKF